MGRGSSKMGGSSGASGGKPTAAQQKRMESLRQRAASMPGIQNMQFAMQPDGNIAYTYLNKRGNYQVYGAIDRFGNAWLTSAYK